MLNLSNSAPGAGQRWNSFSLESTKQIKYLYGSWDCASMYHVRLRTIRHHRPLKSIQNKELSCNLIVGCDSSEVGNEESYLVCMGRLLLLRHQFLFDFGV